MTVLLLILLFSFPAQPVFAEASSSDPSVNLVPRATPTTERPGGDGAKEMLKNTTFNPKPATKKSVLKLSTTCTDARGKIYSPQDSGYNYCVSRDQHKSEPGAKDSATGTKMNFQIGK